LLAQDAVLLLDVLEELELAAVHQPANTSSKNWSGATDIFGILPCRAPGSGGSTRERRAAKRDFSGWFTRSWLAQDEVVLPSCPRRVGR
jgi:hypothetical protein